MSNTLFSPIDFGHIHAKNRILMAPLTRGRADEDRTPNALMAEYYAQRAGAGLIITEATAIDPMGYGWVQAPALYNDKQEEGWKLVTKAVHDNGGKIILQMWHMGRVSHPDFLDGEKPVAPSAIKADGETHTSEGKKPYVEPHALSTDEIANLVQAYADGAKRALRAGFDGVEIHAANGYLLDQFLRDGTNKRDDGYGGSVDNRARLVLEVVDAVIEAIGAGLTGIRISPTNPFNDISDSDPVGTFVHLAKKLNAYKLAYLHVMEPIDAQHAFAGKDAAPYVTPHIRNAYEGIIIANGAYNKNTGNAAIEDGKADAIAYGVPFLANPDLVERFQQDATLNDPDQSTFYTHEAAGYTDYPTLGDAEDEQAA